MRYNDGLRCIYSISVKKCLRGITTAIGQNEYNGEVFYRLNLKEGQGCPTVYNVTKKCFIEKAYNLNS